MQVITDKDKIDEILSRSIDSIYPSKDSLRELLFSGKRITIYVGIDPTADYVHLGHSTNYLILEKFHKLGHRITVLVGDFTAMIGDPSDKTAMRTQLTKEQVSENLHSFKEQIGKILDFSNKENPIEFKFNGEWLSKLDFEEIVKLGSNFTVQQMLERDMFEKRIIENKPLFVHEFFYPLMQGYDSVALDADLEIGGTDQTFNMLAGRTLVKRYLNKEKFVITTTLLTNPITGEKLMSKSLGTGVALNDSAENMFGKVMALADEGMLQMFTDCTRLSVAEIDKLKGRLGQGTNPRDIKLELASEIVSMYHGMEAGATAKANWEKTFTKKELPENIPDLIVDKSKPLTDQLIECNIISSKSDWRRLIKEGAIRDESDKKISDPDFVPDKTLVLKIGKRRFIRVVVS
ncbi:MAG: tyrosine--tRNA ligase [bacterium]|nr:tyrosine--tRNA ligase [bacterium]